MGFSQRELGDLLDREAADPATTGEPDDAAEPPQPAPGTEDAPRAAAPPAPARRGKPAAKAAPPASSLALTADEMASVRAAAAACRAWAGEPLLTDAQALVMIARRFTRARRREERQDDGTPETQDRT